MPFLFFIQSDLISFYNFQGESHFAMIQRDFLLDFAIKSILFPIVVK